MTAPTSPEEASFRERLPAEIAQWQAEGLVHPRQAQVLLARYGLASGETPRTLYRSRIVHVLAVLGVVLTGIGVILLIGANWQSLPKWIRLALLICATAASYHAGYRMAYHSRIYPKVGMALLLLGSLLWGASIFLVAQMYHLGGEGGERAAVLYWLIGVLPLAYILLSPLHLALSLVLGTIWLGMAMVAQFHWMIVQTSCAIVVLAVGVFLYACSRLHSMSRALQGLNAPYRWFGLTYVFVALYALSFRGFWDFRAVHLMAIHWSNWLWLGVPLAVGVAAVVGLFVTQVRRDRVALYEALALSSLLALCVGMAVLTYSSQPVAENYSSSLLVATLFNLLLLAAEIGIIALGWARNQPGLANLGMSVFFVQVVTRYFDLFGGMLSSGLMFVGAGLLLVIGGAALERSRRRLLDSMALRRKP